MANIYLWCVHIQIKAVLGRFWTLIKLIVKTEIPWWFFWYLQDDTVSICVTYYTCDIASLHTLFYEQVKH